MENIEEWAIQTPIRFPWKYIDFDFEGRSFRYVRNSNKYADLLRTHAGDTSDEREKSFRSASRMMSWMSWSLDAPVYWEIGGGYPSPTPVIAIKSKRFCVRARAVYQKNLIHGSFNLPGVIGDVAWKALALYREGRTATSSIHGIVSYAKIIELAFRKNMPRRKWLSQHYGQAIALESPREVASLGSTAEIIKDRLRNAVAHPRWDEDNIKDYIAAQISKRIYRRLAEMVIRSVFRVGYGKTIKEKRFP